MASRAEVEAARRALARLSQSATLALDGLIAEANGDTVRLAAIMRRWFPELLAEYGGGSAALGAAVAEMWASDAGLRPVVQLADPLEAKRAAGLAVWAVEQADPVSVLRDITDQHVKQPYRSTVQGTAHASGGAWARVPSGSSTCAFCLMTASRGAVYGSQRAAGGDGHKYHGHCDCAVVLVRDDSDLPDDYDLAALRDTYDAGASATDSRNPSTREVLAGIRHVTGGH